MAYHLNMHEQWRTWWDQFQTGKLSDPNAVRQISDPMRLQLLYELHCSPKNELAVRAYDAIQSVCAERVGEPQVSPEKCITEIDSAAKELLMPDEPWFATVRKGFLQRRESDMVNQRRIDVQDFRDVYVHETHQHVLWGLYRVNTLTETFRIDEENAFIDVDDNPVDLDTQRVRVGVVHPLELAEPDRNRWDTAFADYNLHGFDQVERQIQHRYGPQVQPFSIGFDGEPLIEKLGIDGWKGDEFGWTTTLKRRFSWAGHLELSTLSIYEDRVSLSFRDLESDGDKEIRSVNPVVLFEAIRSIQQAISAGERDSS